MSARKCQPGAWGGAGCLAHEGFDIGQDGLCVEGRSTRRPPTTSEDRARFVAWLHDPSSDRLSLRAWAVGENMAHDIDALTAENAALRADLARISAELGLPPDIGPALAAIREMRRSEQIHVQIATLFSTWANGDEPEGPPSSSRTLLAIGDCLGVPF